MKPRREHPRAYAEFSKLRLVVGGKNIPSQKKAKEILDVVCKHFDIDKQANTLVIDFTKIIPGQTTITLKIEACKEGLPIVAALEFFTQLLGNITIYSREIEYGRYNPK